MQMQGLAWQVAARFGEVALSWALKLNEVCVKKGKSCKMALAGVKNNMGFDRGMFQIQCKDYAEAKTESVTASVLTL